jgi:hypothetical protein
MTLPFTFWEKVTVGSVLASVTSGKCSGKCLKYVSLIITRGSELTRLTQLNNPVAIEETKSLLESFSDITLDKKSREIVKAIIIKATVNPKI